MYHAKHFVPSIKYQSILHQLSALLPALSQECGVFLSLSLCKLRMMKTGDHSLASFLHPPTHAHHYMYLYQSCVFTYHSGVVALSN
jgi:hypothetical protein